MIGRQGLFRQLLLRCSTFPRPCGSPAILLHFLRPRMGKCREGMAVIVSTTAPALFSAACSRRSSTTYVHVGVPSHVCRAWMHKCSDCRKQQSCPVGRLQSYCISPIPGGQRPRSGEPPTDGQMPRGQGCPGAASRAGRSDVQMPQNKDDAHFLGKTYP